jgi:hypothetical protein
MSLFLGLYCGNSVHISECRMWLGRTAPEPLESLHKCCVLGAYGTAQQGSCQARWGQRRYHLNTANPVFIELAKLLARAEAVQSIAASIPERAAAAL